MNVRKKKKYSRKVTSPNLANTKARQNKFAVTGWTRNFRIAVGLSIAAIIVIAYHNSFHGPFVFDDLEAITENSSIRDLSNMREVLSPPLTVTGAVGRPMVNLSFAVNYALFGTRVVGYHVTNLLIHICAALLLFGAIRRTLILHKASATLSNRPVIIAGFGAAMWAVHPLITESVTSTVQRSESLMGLFFLTTFYCFIRFVEADKAQKWGILAVVFCFLGVATKEVMAVCPMLLLLFDWIFISKSFLDIWKQRRLIYSALFLSWGLLIYLIISTQGRNQTVGFDYGVSWWEYLLTQCYGIGNYLWLAFWPRNLVFDYGTIIVTDPARVIPGVLILTALFGVTIWAIFRRKPIGFLGAVFFAILAPSSSILPLTSQTLAEHRMYLPLIPVILVIVMLLERLKRMGLLIAIFLIPLLVWGTIHRNGDYRTALRLWSDTVEKMPENARAHNDLANALANTGEPEAALEHYRRSIELNPNAAITYYNMADTLVALGRSSQAESAYKVSVQLNPEYVKAHNDLGNLLAREKKWKAAWAHFKIAARLAPERAGIQMNAGNALMAMEQWQDAQQYFRQVLKIEPDHEDAINNLGAALMRSGNVAEAVTLFSLAIERHPDDASMRYNLGKALSEEGRLDAAVDAYRQALRIRPQYPKVYYNIGNIRFQQQRYADAIDAYKTAISQKPDYISAINNLGSTYKNIGAFDKAIAQYKRVLQLQTSHRRAQRNLLELQALTGEKQNP